MPKYPTRSPKEPINNPTKQRGDFKESMAQDIIDEEDPEFISNPGEITMLNKDGQPIQCKIIGPKYKTEIKHIKWGNWGDREVLMLKVGEYGSYIEIDENNKISHKELPSSTKTSNGIIEDLTSPNPNYKIKIQIVGNELTITISERPTSETIFEKAEQKVLSDLKEKVRAANKKEIALYISYPSLTQTMAKEIIKYNGPYLYLNEVTSLTPKTAQILSGSNAEKSITFNRLKNIDAQSMDKLTKNLEPNRIELYLTNLTQETARVMVENTASTNKEVELDISGKIDTKTAKELVKFSGYRLYLGNVRGSQEVYKIFQEANNPNIRVKVRTLKGMLDLDKYSGLNPMVTREIVKVNCDILSLDGVKELSLKDAKILSTMKARVVSLDGLEEIDAKTMFELTSGFRGEQGNVSGLDYTWQNDWSKEKKRGNEVWLSGLTEIDEATAKVLIENMSGSGKVIDLSGLRTISEETALELVKFKGDELYLGNVEAETLEAYKIIERNRGRKKHKIEVRDLEFSLFAKLELNIENANNSVLDLSYLTKITPKIAGKIIEYNGESLMLNGLQELHVNTASRLAKSKVSNITLNGLRQTNAGTMKTLTQDLKANSIALNGLTSIDSETAKAFVQNIKGSKQRLQLTGLAEIPDDVANELKDFKGGMLFLGDSYVSDSAYDLLKENESIYTEKLQKKPF